MYVCAYSIHAYITIMYPIHSKSQHKIIVNGVFFKVSTPQENGITLYYCGLLVLLSDGISQVMVEPGLRYVYCNAMVLQVHVFIYTYMVVPTGVDSWNGAFPKTRARSRTKYNVGRVIADMELYICRSRPTGPPTLIEMCF